jgi:hypothetical protein
VLQYSIPENRQLSAGLTFGCTFDSGFIYLLADPVFPDTSFRLENTLDECPVDLANLMLLKLSMNALSGLGVSREADYAADRPIESMWNA